MNGTASCPPTTLADVLFALMNGAASTDSRDKSDNAKMTGYFMISFFSNGAMQIWTGEFDRNL